jgi:hypothetical protein
MKQWPIALLCTPLFEIALQRNLRCIKDKGADKPAR